MSRIYIGNPLRGAGLVAIKQMTPAVSAAEAAEDFRQFALEYRILSTLTHPSLPMALDFFTENGSHYLVEEFIPGDTLQARLEQSGRLPPPRAVAVAVQLLDVLAYLHDRGIIYRDLKPENILITRSGTLRIIDFGAARRYRPGATRDTVPLGTPGFASPEHYGSAQTDARSDVYSAGALLHFMFTGLDPAQGTPFKFAAPHDVVCEVPEFFSRIVTKAVALDPRDRYQSAREMWRVLLYQEERDSAESMAAMEWPSVLPVALAGPRPPTPARRAVALPGREARLIHLRRRLQYDDPFSYLFRARKTAGMVVGALVLAAVQTAVGDLSFVPAALGAGAALGAAGYLSAYLQWRLHRHLLVEVFDEGIRICDQGCDELLWAEVVSLHLLTRGLPAVPQAGILATSCVQITLPAAWPGYDEVVNEIVGRAGLVENPMACGTHPATGTVVMAYERAH